MASFKPGESGNPDGRPKGAGGGRTLALANLDKMLARPRNQGLLIRAMEKEFKKDPVRFFRTMIMPLLPREARLEFEHDGVVKWKSLVGEVSSAERQAGSAEEVDRRTECASHIGKGVVIDVEAREATP